MKIKELKELLNQFDDEEEVKYISIHLENRFINCDIYEDNFDCKLGNIEETISLNPGDDLYDIFHDARNLLNDKNNEFWNDFYINVYGSYELPNEKYTHNGLIAKIMVENGTCDIERIIHKRMNKNDIIKNIFKDD